MSHYDGKYIATFEDIDKEGLKVAILGHWRVGKKSFVRRFVYDSFVDLSKYGIMSLFIFSL